MRRSRALDGAWRCGAIFAGGVGDIGIRHLWGRAPRWPVAESVGHRFRAVGGIGQSSNDGYNGNGNAATSTNAAGDTVTTVFDAWGRPVSYASTSYVDKRLYYQNETIQYDALGRVIGVFQQAGFPGASSGTETTQHVMAYDALTGQAIQEDQGTGNTGAAVYAQYVYGPDGHMILRDRNNNGGAGLNERLYVATAPDGSVVAIINASGQVVERYVYDGLGNVQALDPTGAPYGVSSGVYSGIPENQLGQQYSGSTFNTSTNLITNAGTAFDWNYFYQGQRYNGIPGVYGSGAQSFNPRQQSLLTPDLGAIQAGISAYDPTGGATGINLIGEEFANGVSGIGAALAPDFGSGVGSFAGPGIGPDIGSALNSPEFAPVSAASHWLAEEVNAWGASEASRGSVGLGTLGFFLGGVSNTLAAVTNPVGSLWNLGEASAAVGERYGAGWGVAYGVGSLVGATQFAQAYEGENFATGQSYGTMDRWGQFFGGVSALSGTSALALALRIGWARRGRGACRARGRLRPATGSLFSAPATSRTTLAAL